MDDPRQGHELVALEPRQAPGKEPSYVDEQPSEHGDDGPFRPTHRL